MIKVEVDDTKVRVWLDKMPQNIHVKLRQAVDKLTILMQNYVRRDKLSGQVLNFHTHHLQQSIQRDIEDSPSRVMGVVFNNKTLAPYGAIHEFGGVIPGHEIIATKAKALAFLWNGKQMFLKRVMIPDVTMPERSFLRSSLSDNQILIREELTAAVADGMK